MEWGFNVLPKKLLLPSPSQTRLCHSLALANSSGNSNSSTTAPLLFSNSFAFSNAAFKPGPAFGQTYVLANAILAPWSWKVDEGMGVSSERRKMDERSCRSVMERA